MTEQAKVSDEQLEEIVADSIAKRIGKPKLKDLLPRTIHAIEALREENAALRRQALDESRVLDDLKDLCRELGIDPRKVG